MPDSGAAVWIRRYPALDQPVMATSNYSADLNFNVDIIGPNQQAAYFFITISATFVHSWRFQNLADELAWSAPP